MRRLISLDYIIERPTFGWLPTEGDKVQRFEALGLDRRTLRPRHLTRRPHHRDRQLTWRPANQSRGYHANAHHVRLGPHLASYRVDYQTRVLPLAPSATATHRIAFAVVQVNGSAVLRCAAALRVTRPARCGTVAVKGER